MHEIDNILAFSFYSDLPHLVSCVLAVCKQFSHAAKLAVVIDMRYCIVLAFLDDLATTY